MTQTITYTCDRCGMVFKEAPYRLEVERNGTFSSDSFNPYNILDEDLCERCEAELEMWMNLENE
jgi:hypothetical protein